MQPELSLADDKQFGLVHVGLDSDGFIKQFGLVFTDSGEKLGCPCRGVMKFGRWDNWAQTFLPHS